MTSKLSLKWQQCRPSGHYPQKKKKQVLNFFYLNHNCFGFFEQRVHCSDISLVQLLLFSYIQRYHTWVLKSLSCELLEAGTIEWRKLAVSLSYSDFLQTYAISPCWKQWPKQILVQFSIDILNFFQLQHDQNTPSLHPFPQHSVSSLLVLIYIRNKLDKFSLEPERVKTHPVALSKIPVLTMSQMQS